MPKTSDKKTNAMRMLDEAGIQYSVLAYECDGVNFDGKLVAGQIGLPCHMVYKTLVVKGGNSGKNNIAVCCVPVDKKLDLKALAAAAGQKRMEMARLDEILSLTGYVRGGCSPVGMKKKYPAFIDAAASKLEKIAVSAGVRGKQILLGAGDLISFIEAATGEFAADTGED